MGQLLLLPDPRPLDERLGPDFFRAAPRTPGVYLMRDAADRILYVGKAKDLRQRLNHYRVANPDRMPRRHLRLVRDVTRIEFKLCETEAHALEHEAYLLRTIRPKFNRAGTWPGKPRFVVWQTTGDTLHLSVVETPSPTWRRFGPLGANAIHLHQIISRLLWLAANPTRSVHELPTGWVRGKFMENTAITCPEDLPGTINALESLFWSEAPAFVPWLEAKLINRINAFERNVITDQLTELADFAAKIAKRKGCRQQLWLL